MGIGLDPSGLTESGSMQEDGHLLGEKELGKPMLSKLLHGRKQTTEDW